MAEPRRAVGLQGGSIARWPGNRSTPTVTERERRHLEPEQVERLASAFPDRYQALIYAMGYCGLRLGEATGLKIDDLDMLRRRLSVVRTASQVAGKVVEGPPKTPESKRTIAIPAFVRDLLAAHIARFPIEGGYVFGGDNGRQLHPNIFRKHQWSRAVRESGLGPLTPHDLRRTTAAILVKGGATIQEIARYLGHKNAAITSELYAGILDSVATDAADRMDATYRAAQGHSS
jgi:integrase